MDVIPSSADSGSLIICYLRQPFPWQLPPGTSLPCAVRVLDGDVMAGLELAVPGDLAAFVGGGPVEGLAQRQGMREGMLDVWSVHGGSVIVLGVWSGRGLLGVEEGPPGAGPGEQMIP